MYGKISGDLCKDDGHRSGDLCSCGGAGIPEDPEGTAGRSIKECGIKEERRKACDGILTEERRAEADIQPPLCSVDHESYRDNRYM